MRTMALMCLMILAVAEPLFAAEKSIAAYYAITNITNITISFAPKGDFGLPDTKSWSISDPAFLRKTRELLNILPSSGVLFKDWPDDLPKWQVKISESNATHATLTIWGTRLEAPLTRDGGFYWETGGREQEFVRLIQSSQEGRTPNNGPSVQVTRHAKQSEKDHRAGPLAPQP